MGSRSKQTPQERGAFGSKKFARKVTLERDEEGVDRPTFHVVGVSRPNRGRRRGVIKLAAKGRRPLNINAMRAKQTVAPAAKRPGVLGKLKRMFQRKGE